MNRFRIVFLILVATFLFSSGFVSASKKIYLQSRIFRPREKVSGVLQDKLQAKDTLPFRERSERTHILLQLDYIPTPEERGMFEEREIELLSYVPRNTWMASVPEDKISSLSNRNGVSFVGDIKPEDKLSPTLRKYGLSERSRTNNSKAKLRVTFFRDVTEREIGNILFQENMTVLQEPEVGKTWVIKLPDDNFKGLAKVDEVKWISNLPPEKTILNDNSRQLIEVNRLHEPPYNLRGQGITAAMWDAGWAGKHEDLNYTGKLVRGDSGYSVKDHATHVAGTMLGNGTINNQYRGMAPNASLVTYEWPGSEDELYDETNDSMVSHGSILSQNSWGYKGSNAMYLGLYDSWSRAYDDIISGESSLKDRFSIIFAAGNARDDHDFDYNTTVGPGGTAKNTITVGAVDDSGDMTSYSSWGPTDDGRIKPTVVADGGDSGGLIASTVPDKYIDQYFYYDCDGTGDDFCYPYDEMGGTSMAAPAVSGAVILLNEEFNQTYGRLPAPATVKAALIHTAQDLNRTGPDYTTGWGLVNATSAIRYINGSVSENLIRRENISSTGDNYTYEIGIPEDDNSLNVTLVWSDYPGDPQNGRQLVNDLDLIVKNSSGHRFYPWTLNYTQPSQPAVRTREDHRNVVEQVVVSNPQSQTWTITVNGASVPHPKQDYSLLLDQNSATSPPSLSLLKPENRTYTNQEFLPLNYTTDGTEDMVWYELQGQNTTLSGNTTFNVSSDGHYTLTLYTNNSEGLVNSESVTLSVDTTPPAWWGNDTSPDTGVDYSSGRDYQFNITWDDTTTGVGNVIIEENMTGDMENHTFTGQYEDEYYYEVSDLAAGNYTYQWYANDSAGNWNSTDQWTYVVIKNQTNPVNLYLNGTLNDNNTYTYPEVVNATGSAVYSNSGNVNLYRNESEISGANETVRLANGIHSYRANITGNENYTSNSTGAFYYAKVLKGTPPISLSLNGTSDNQTYTYPETVNATGWLNTLHNEGEVDLWREGSIIGTADTVSDTIRLANGTYNYSLTFNATQNYTADSITSGRFAKVMKGTPILKTWIDSSASNKTVTYPTTVDVKGNTTADITPPPSNLFLGGQSAGSGDPATDSKEMSVGLHNLIYNTSGNANWTSSENASLYLNVTKGPVNIDLWLNGSKNSGKTITYPQISNTTTKINITKGEQDSFDLFRNGTQVGSQAGTLSKNLTRLKASVWNFTAVYSGNENYSSFSRTNYLTVDPGTPSIYLSLNGTEDNRTYTYPETVNATGWLNTLNNEGEVDLWREGSIIGTADTVSDTIRLANGTYNYSLTFNATQNYTADSITSGRFAKVMKGSQKLMLALNGTLNDTTYGKGEVANLTAWSNITQNNITDDMTLIANFTGNNRSIPISFSGLNTLQNLTDTGNLAVNKYEVSANVSATQNYSAAWNNSLIMTVEDTTVPTVSIYNYSNAIPMKSGDSLGLNISLSDNDEFGAFNASVWVNNNTTSYVLAGKISNSSVANSKDEWANGSVSIPAGLVDGNNTLKVNVSDSSGNEGMNTSYVVLVDNTNPSASVSVSDSRVSTDSSVTISCSKSDPSPSSGITSELKVTKPNGDVVKPSCGTFSDTSGVGTYDITYKVTDYAGNSDSDSASFETYYQTVTAGPSATVIPSVSHIWAEIPTGATESLEVDNPDIGLSKVEFSVKNTVTDVKVTVKKQEDKPFEVKEEVEGKVNRYATIQTENLKENNTQNARIRFSVSKSWIQGNNVSPDRVYLNRYADHWEKLTTRQLDETEEEYIYEAETPGFSYFAISGEEKVKEKKEACPYECCVGMEDYKDKLCDEGYECQDNECVEIEKKECPTCPEPTQWSECVNGTQTRTNYRCSEETNYTCQSYQEEQSCEVPEKKPEMPIWPLIGIVVIVLIAAAAYWKREELTS